MKAKHILKTLTCYYAAVALYTTGFLVLSEKSSMLLDLALWTSFLFRSLPGFLALGIWVGLQPKTKAITLVGSSVFAVQSLYPALLWDRSFDTLFLVEYCASALGFLVVFHLLAAVFLGQVDAKDVAGAYRHCK